MDVEFVSIYLPLLLVTQKNNSLFLFPANFLFSSQHLLGRCRSVSPDITLSVNIVVRGCRPSLSTSDRGSSLHPQPSCVFPPPAHMRLLSPSSIVPPPMHVGHHGPSFRPLDTIRPPSTTCRTSNSLRRQKRLLLCTLTPWFLPLPTDHRDSSPTYQLSCLHIYPLGLSLKIASIAARLSITWLKI
jgi:hypothetical protein